VCLVGAPNVGKSTIVNSIVGKKVLIVSDKPQTTRNRINVIFNLGDNQVVFVDTPGIHKAVHKLGNYLVKIAIKALEGNDLILFVISSDRIGKSDETVAQRVEISRIPFIGVVNKIDQHHPANVERAEKIFGSMSNCVDIMHVSALKGKGIKKLVGEIVENLPESPHYYPSDMLSDKPLTFMISEIVREKIFNFTYQELPYSSAVNVDYMEEKPNLMKIWATIFVERDSQRPILLGKAGNMIKKIGTLARKDVEKLLDKHVFLSLHVKVKPKWSENERALNEFFKNEF